MSLHFPETAVDLVSNCAAGFTFKDFLTTFRLIYHVLSTKRSCQTKGPKLTTFLQKTAGQLELRITQTL